VRADVLVPGGGATGCVLARRLSEDPERSVCLVGRTWTPRRTSVGGCGASSTASAIPTIPQANTNLTTIALAERAAEWL